MEIVDMGITRFGIWGRKSRSVNNSSQWSDFGLLHVIIIRGGSKCAEKTWAPPGAAKHEMEQFRRMEMVDMVITRIWFSGRKSRSVNNFLQRLVFGLILDKFSLV